MSFKLIGSPKITTPNTMAMTTLSLSIGATQEAATVFTHKKVIQF